MSDFSFDPSQYTQQNTGESTPPLPPTTYDAIRPILSNLPKGSGVNLNIPVVNPAQEAFATGQISDLEALKEAYEPKFDEDGNLIPGTGFATPGVAEYVAGLSPNQLGAINLATSGVGAYQPFLDISTGYFADAGGTADTLTNLIGGATGLGGQATGTAAGGTDVAFGRIGDVNRRIAGLEAGGARSFDPTDISSFMDPFTQDVIDQSLADIQRESDIARNTRRAEAARAGAFGGSRAAVMDAELDRATLEQKAQTAAELRRAGFESAQQRAQKAFEDQQNRFLAANQLGLGSLIDAGQLGLGAGELGLKGITTGLAGLETAGDLTKSQIDAFTGLGEAGLDQARIATALNAADIQTLLSTGQINQGQAQALLNAQRQDELSQLFDPFTFYQLIGDLGRGVPFQQTQLNVGGRVPSGGGGSGGGSPNIGLPSIAAILGED